MSRSSPGASRSPWQGPGVSSVVRRALALVQWTLALALVPGLVWLDRELSDDGTLGRERHAVRGGLMRIAERPDADGVVILGSSTSRDWIAIHWLPRVFGEEPQDVLDAHVNGCHQGCAWAEVRRLLAQGRHFRVALFGTNQFQMCEEEHSKRVLQHRELAPEGDVLPDLLAYLHAQRPLRWIARHAFGTLSGVYADTLSVQKKLGDPILGKASRRANRAFIRPVSDAHRTVWCPYSDRDIAYKRALSRRLYVDLARLADETFILLLPDRSLVEGGPQVQAAWERHRQVQRELVAEHESLHLLDFTAGQQYSHDDFKDPVHVTMRHGGRMRARFQTLLREGGHIPGSR